MLVKNITGDLSDSSCSKAMGLKLQTSNVRVWEEETVGVHHSWARVEMTEGRERFGSGPGD